MAMKQLYINGTGTGDYGIYISSDTYLSAPSIEYTEYQVPGRNGNLVNSSGRLNNIVRKFDCYIPNNAQANFDEFKKLLYGTIGYMEITSDYEPDTYQLGYLAQGLEATPFLSDDVLKISFELYFSCQPQKYYKEAEHITYTRTGSGQDRYVIPKTDGWIRGMLRTIPSYDLPRADYYVVQVSDSITSITDMEVSFPSSDFIGVAVMEFSPSTQNIIEYLGYANDGNTLTIDSYTIPSGYDNLSIVYIVPLESVGTLHYQYTKDGIQRRGDIHFAPIIDYTMTEFPTVGINATYTFTFSTHAPGRWSLHNYTVIKGLLNEQEQWKGIIDINASELAQLVGISASPDFELIIDSENLTVRGGKIGDNLNLNSYVNIIGQIDGLADEIVVISYPIVEGQVNIEAVDINPRWWKV